MFEIVKVIVLTLPEPMILGVNTLLKPGAADAIFGKKSDKKVVINV